SIWNAASFYQEASYLYFPTLQAELASDISFYFKTSSPSGVFLENQGLKDFIRVELSSPAVVTFSFDVGNGPAVLSVKSHLPLNDRQWHYVRAERNVKEASLQVDQLPLRLLEAPADGHLRLRLSSQLFVGGTASQQRGFLGCIRSLMVNGLTFDLEERAKMTPGVSSGCPGYCSGSSSLCHNRGRCIEKSNGYICDCSQSAYGGATCNQEVSVSFDRESSVTYTFQEPFSVMQNRSSQASSAFTESRAREDVAFSFVTSQRPAMLLTVSTFSQQYITTILARNGSLQIWYHLQTDRSPDIFSPVPKNLADGRLHRIRIHRVGRNLYVQIDQDIHRKYTLSSDAELILIRSLTLGKVIRMESFDEEVVKAASRGFVGCLSSVQFNHVAPLKAALTNRGSSLITIRGPLVQSNCGALAESTSHILQDQAANEDKEQRDSNAQKDLAVIAGVVTAVVFIAVCALAVISRLLYQQRRAKRSSSMKEEHRHSTYTDYRTELHLQNSVRDNVKEYYI
ncbi:PREDICTED: contactin-associated protein-like 5, partial [Cyprinodon variegatus]|uniref:contactin-associated protein-like 5 n=1 Tax=Cyprinodon variegatus TaxID=28743 RepID=UPI00074274D9